MTARLRRAHGFTVIELLISMAITIGITGAMFALINPARGTYRIEPEVSDMQQRLRVATNFVKDDLMMAGAGSQAGGALLGALMNYFAPIQPVILGGPNADPAQGVFFRDNAITIFYIPPNAPQASISEEMPQPSAELKIGADPHCAPPDGPLCNWKEGMRVLIFDDEGAFDTMTLTQVQEGAGGGATAGMLQHNKHLAGNELSKRYSTRAQVAQVLQRTYYWDQAARQLRYFDGASRDEVAVDDVVNVRFDYSGEPRPPVLFADGKTTTYGPKPPALGTQTKGNGNNNVSAWPPGENCMFRVDPLNGMMRVGRIPDLVPGSQALVPMPQQMLTDGPWCPDANFPTRFDADLLRLRKIGMRVRVQVASAELRGPAGVLFAVGGTSRSGRNLVPDLEMQFEVSPRNFNFGR